MPNEYIAVEGSERKPLPGATVTGRANPNATLEISLKLRRKNPLPPVTGRPTTIMSRKELGETYGASKEDIDKVVQVFGRHGLQPVDTNPATRTVRLRGTIADMEEAFQVRLFSYAHEDGAYRGRVGAVHVPMEVKDIVQGVFGLDNRRVARRRRQPAQNDAHMHLASASSAWYISSQLAKHYNFPAGDGTGHTVGLLEFGGGYFSDDLKTFCSMAKIETPPKVTAISTDGTPTNSRDGAEGEVMLDVEVVAGICPRANIAVYFAHWSEQGWITALDAAVHDDKNDPGVLSVSWGYAEDADIWTRQAMHQVNETLQEAAKVGVTVCIAAGDDGSSDAITDGHAHVDYPSSSPYVVAVGGTTIPPKGTNHQDIVWKEGDGLRADNGGSTGGGVSVIFPRPDWQKSINIKSVNPGSILGRCIPDLAANADWIASPYLLVVDGGAQPNGGTSAASPLIAALFTLINAKLPQGKRVGYVTPLLYQSVQGSTKTVGAEGCTDIVSGSNTTDPIGGYHAGPGYDCASGWGAPDGTKLEQAIRSFLEKSSPPVVA